MSEERSLQRPDSSEHMKLPFPGDFQIVTTNLPEAFRKQLLEDNKPRYVWVSLPQPIRELGCDFPFIVLPIKMTPDSVLKQCGRGVLCQTEAEAKESVELLTERDKEHIVVAEAPGFGVVAKVTNSRSVITEQSVRSRSGGKDKRIWYALEREIDKATGEVAVLRRQDAADEADATRIAKQWLREYEQEKKLYFDAVAKSNAPPPPACCKPLTAFELKEDVPAAKWTALRRQWPRTFEIFDRRKQDPKQPITAHEYQDAYLLDLVEQGYDPKDETIRGDLKLAEALTKAAKNFARAGKRRLSDLAVYLIAFNYELGWCYLSDTEIARKLQGILNKRFTQEQVKKYRYRTLGLVAKHFSGPTPKST